MRYWREEEEGEIDRRNGYDDLPSTPPGNDSSDPKSKSQPNQLPHKIGRLFPQTEQKILGAGTGALKPQALRLPSLSSSAFGLGQQSTSSGKTTELKTVKTYKSHRIDSDSSEDEDGDDMMALATRMLALEKRRKEQIEARGLPPGCTHWWEARHLADE
jgi:hypothetical protein